MRSAMAAVETPVRRTIGLPKATSGIDCDGALGRALRGVDVRIEPHGKLPLVPFDALQMVFEHLAHRELARSTQIDEIDVSVEKHFASVGSQLGAQEQPMKLELLLGVGHRLAEFDQRHAVLGSKRTQYVGLDQVVEGQLERLGIRRLYQRVEGRMAYRPWDSRDPPATSVASRQASADSVRPRRGRTLAGCEGRRRPLSWG